MPEPSELCVIIHGFTGSPTEVAPLADTLRKQGYEVISPLLPGHNFTKARMKKVHAFEWTQAIEEVVAKAVKQKQIVHLIGFSMGAMIAASIAQRFPVRTLVLLSPAVYVITPKVVATRTKKTLRLLKEDRNQLTKSVRNNLKSVRQAPFSNVLQFRKVVRNTKKMIPDINIPVCIVHGLEDELVDPKSSKWIYNTVSSQDKELHQLPVSSHLVCHGVESDILIQKVTDFLKHHSSQTKNH